MDFLIGADPEFFLTYNGKGICAHEMVEGTKQHPQKVQSGAVQVDGMALEFNIDPAASERKFIHNVNTVLSALRDMIPEELTFSFQSSIEFDKETMDNTPLEARMLGCEPDFNAWTGEQNPVPDDTGNIRTAAGHIHLGWGEGFDVDSKDHFNTCRDIVKKLDGSLGLWSVEQADDYVRKQMYGKAGAFRPKPYGLEYRVLSNFWVTEDEVIKTVYNKAFSILYLHFYGSKDYEKLVNEQGEEIEDAINTCDRFKSLALIKDLERGI